MPTFNPTVPMSMASLPYRLDRLTGNYASSAKETLVEAFDMLQGS